MLRILTSILLVLIFASIAATQDSKAGLRILFVGHDPKAPKTLFSDFSKERVKSLYRERTAAYEALLRFHFDNVTVVYGENYKVEMSNEADVTIFDTPPKVITPAVREEGNYQPAVYLPNSFDRAALSISAATALIGEPMGSKLDWL